MINNLEIKERMKLGDLETASLMIGITPANASKALVRVGSKHHEKLINAIEKVIKTREALINEAAHC